MDRQEFEERCKNGESPFTAPYIYEETLESLRFAKEVKNCVDFEDLSDWDKGRGRTVEKEVDGRFLRLIYQSSPPKLYWVRQNGFFSKYWYGDDEGWQPYRITKHGWRGSWNVAVELASQHWVDFVTMPDDETLSHFKRVTHEEMKTLAIWDLLPITFRPNLG